MAARHSAQNDLTAEYVRQRLDYDPATGSFRWKSYAGSAPRENKRWNTRYAGKQAGTVRSFSASSPLQYVQIKLRNFNYLAHRLAWLYVYGEWPEGELDHINGDSLDNRIANLRLATTSQNQANRRINQNNASGFKGVCKLRARFRAKITREGQARHLGTFDTPEEAHAAYAAAAREHFGEFARGE